MGGSSQNAPQGAAEQFMSEFFGSHRSQLFGEDEQEGGFFGRQMFGHGSPLEAFLQ